MVPPVEGPSLGKKEKISGSKVFVITTISRVTVWSGGQTGSVHNLITLFRLRGEGLDLVKRFYFAGACTRQDSHVYCVSLTEHSRPKPAELLPYHILQFRKYPWYIMCTDQTHTHTHPPTKHDSLIGLNMLRGSLGQKAAGQACLLKMS